MTKLIVKYHKVAAALKEDGGGEGVVNSPLPYIALDTSKSKKDLAVDISEVMAEEFPSFAWELGDCDGWVIGSATGSNERPLLALNIFILSMTEDSITYEWTLNHCDGEPVSHQRKTTAHPNDVLVQLHTAIFSMKSVVQDKYRMYADLMQGFHRIDQQ